MNLHYSFLAGQVQTIYCQLCSLDKQVLHMGSEGDFGWIIHDNFEHGQLGHCCTYGNPPLVSGATSKILEFEVYRLQSIYLALHRRLSSICHCR